MAEMSDDEILKQFEEESTKEKAFSALVQKFQEKLYWHIRRMVVSHDDADDVLQNVFIKVWKNLGKFKGNSKLYTWLYRIATNECLTFIQKRKKHKSTPLLTDEFDLSEQLEADPWFDGDAAQIKLQLAIEGLPPKQRQVFELRYFEEMKYDEMAELVDTSVGALKASFHHAVKKIEKYMKED